MVITIFIHLMCNKQIQMVKLPSYYCLLVCNQFKSWELPSVTCLKVENLVIKLINYRLSFVWYGNSKILKLLIPSNEWGFSSKITVLWPPLLLPLITVVPFITDLIQLNRYWSLKVLMPVPEAVFLVVCDPSMNELWANGIAHFKKCKQLFEYRHLLLLRDIWLSKL